MSYGTAFLHGICFVAVTQTISAFNLLNQHSQHTTLHAETVRSTVCYCPAMLLTLKMYKIQL